MTTKRRATSPQMERIIQQLATLYEMDLSQARASLSLEMPTRTDRWIITNLDGARLSVTRCMVEDGNCLGLELDMVFALHPEGWEPIELLHSDAVWKTYVQAAKEAGSLIYDEQGDTLFAHFTEYYAHQLQLQGWLEHSRKVEEARDHRLLGCQSTHPGACYGELWQCAACQKTVCFAEGSDNHPELCDDCWCKQYGGLEDDVPF